MDNFFKLEEVSILASSEMMGLETTFLPLPNLKVIVSSLELEESFGFLQKLDGISDNDVIKWGFLKRFGIGSDAGISFWLTLLTRAR